MKKIFIGVLVLCLCLSLCACGKSESIIAAEEAISAIGTVTKDSGDAIANAEKFYNILTDSEKAEVENRMALVDAQEAYDAITSEIIYANAKDAYDKLNEISTLCIKDMDDIYGAWWFGLYEAEDAGSSLFFFSMAEKLATLTATDLETAATDYGYSVSKLQSDWNTCVWVVEAAHTIRGDYDTINNLLAEASTIMQTLTSVYEDYTYYPKLKELYSAVNSYAEFVITPTGSFEQLADTVNTFENNIRTLQSDVGFLFDK